MAAPAIERFPTMAKAGRRFGFLAAAFLVSRKSRHISSVAVVLEATKLSLAVSASVQPSCGWLLLAAQNCSQRYINDRNGRLPAASIGCVGCCSIQGVYHGYEVGPQITALIRLIDRTGDSTCIPQCPKQLGQIRLPPPRGFGRPRRRRLSGVVGMVIAFKCLLVLPQRS